MDNEKTNKGMLACFLAKKFNLTIKELPKYDYKIWNLECYDKQNKSTDNEDYLIVRLCLYWESDENVVVTYYDQKKDDDVEVRFIKLIPNSNIYGIIRDNQIISYSYKNELGDYVEIKDFININIVHSYSDDENLAIKKQDDVSINND